MDNVGRSSPMQTDGADWGHIPDPGAEIQWTGADGYEHFGHVVRREVDSEGDMMVAVSYSWHRKADD